MVFDDIPLEPSSFIENEQLFAGLIYTISARQTSLIATSRYNVPTRVRNALGIPPSSELSVPHFDNNEIEQLCVQLGCPTKQAKMQAKVAHLHTSGHPQLVHARLITLSREGWSKVSANSFLKTPDDVKEQQQQARLLLDSLAQEERELLYRASVALSPFRKEHIVLLGEYVKLPRPGDLFDRLLGPWIEKATGDYFELSPLLKNAGAEVWSQSTINNIHSQLADATLSANELSITDASHALFHALIGKNKHALTGLGISLLTRAPREVLKALGENVPWFLLMHVGEDSRPLFPGNQALSSLLRMTQFRLCTAAEPKKVLPILDAWEKEVNHLDQTPKSLFNKMLFYTNALLYAQTPIPLSRVMQLFKEFAVVRQEILTHGDKKLTDALLLTQIEHDGEVVNSMALLFGMNGMRCQSMQELDDYLQNLAQLDESFRQELLQAFDMPEGFASYYMDNAYLNEYRSENPDWNFCLQVLSRTMDHASEWQIPSLGASAAQTSSIILDEHLNRYEDALAKLDEGAKQFPSHSWIVEEHRGTILLHSENYDKAVKAFTQALEGRDNCLPEALHTPIYAFRNAGIAAAHANKWDVAADFFLRGHHCAQSTDNSVLAAAFQTDTAYAFWESGLHRSMLESLRSSIALIDTMDKSKNDLNKFSTFRLTTHTLSWLLGVVEDGQPPDGLAKPFAGMCSNPDRNEEILTLPDIPFDFALYFLIKLEQSLKAEPLSLELYGDRLDLIKLPSIMMFMSRLRVEKAFSTGSFEQLPSLIDRMVRSYVATKMLTASEKPIWSTVEDPISEDKVKETLIDEDFLDGPFLAALLRSCVTGTTSACFKSIEEWRRSAAGLSWEDNLIMYLDDVELLLSSSISKLRSILHSREASHRDRQLASLFLAQRPSDIGLPDLLQAHIFLLDQFSQSGFYGQFVEETLSEIIASAWALKAKARFLLCSPNITAPALEVACTMKPECFGKSAAILLAAAEASGIKFPKPLDDRYRLLRSSI